MKVYIGKYKNHFGCYQLVEPLKYLGVSKTLRIKLAERFANTALEKFLDFINKTFRNQTIYVKVDPEDTWSMDHTLAHIILPMLKQLQATKHGSPLVSDEDVPEELASTSAPKKQNDWDCDDNHHKRWDWVLAEMIWTFEQYNKDWEEAYYTGKSDYQFEKILDSEYLELKQGPNHTLVVDSEGLKKHDQRINRGLILFGKYYRALWD